MGDLKLLKKVLIGNRITKLDLPDLSSLRDQVANSLRQAILTGAIMPGERINEEKFANYFGTSRPPLREAIRILEKEGLLVSSPRRGAKVRAFSGVEILEIYEVRFAIEYCAAMAVSRLQDNETFDTLEKSLHLGRKTQIGLSDAITEDLVFHRLLVESSRNSKLLEMWDLIAGQLRLALVLINPKYFEEEFIVSTHLSQIAAMRRGDLAELHSVLGSFDEVAQNLKQRWENFRIV